MNTYALAPVESVVTAAEVAAWLAIDETDPLISMLSLSATSAIIEYLQAELISRSRKLTYKHWPTVGTNTSPSLSNPNECWKREIELPYSHTTLAVDSSKSYNETLDVNTLAGKPYSIRVDSWPSVDCDYIALDIEYTTGYETIDDVPYPIKMAALNMIAFMYEHRGACDANEAMNKSGASESLGPYKTYVVVI